MPRETKVFEVSVEDEKPEPLRFKVKFTYPHDPDREAEEEEFEALPSLSAGINFALTSITRFDERGRQVTDFMGVLTFFQRVLDPESWVRFKRLLDDQDREVPMDVIVSLFEWLTEEYTGRPTRRSRRSSAGPRATSGRSTGSRSSAG